MRFVLFLVAVLWLDQPVLAKPEFDQAKIAATEGRYHDVVAIMNGVLTGIGISEADQVIAYSNRGIAYSLLHEYELAETDLNQALALDADHGLSLNHMGILAEHVKQDFPAAVEWYQRASRKGYPASMVNLANLLRGGTGVDKDPKSALELYKHAVDAGYRAAAVPLGAMLLSGEAGISDTDHAMSLFIDGIAAGDVAGHFYVGLMYEHGMGVSQDYNIAHDHYRLAANKGHGPSQGALGYLYRRGAGIEKNFDEAVKWYRVAAEQGNSVAANRLAWLLATCPTASVCNGKVALAFARLAVSEERSTTNLDSLAAAYARLGRFDEALAVINEILGRDALTVPERQKFETRVDRYSNGIPSQL